MATIYNSNLSKELIDVAKLQVNTDFVPNQIADKVVPVIDVNPKHARIANLAIATGALTNQTSATLFTAPTDRDTYITGASMAIIKDATATTTVMALRCTVDGKTCDLLAFPGITLTAQQGAISNSWDNVPIKIDRGTTISMVSGTNVANIVVQATVQGFQVENIRA